ncbi:GNAT family N-acetyltransferase [Aeromicrobium sp.]|uniref:GNAT family N-acetyltransferase n=1 Tax=Aeromicrobium sp. TaxID=1871063 RepID=UPI002FC8A412
MTDLERVPFDHPDAVALRAEHVAYGNQLYASDPSSVHRSGSEGIEPASVVATVVAYDDDGPVGHACLRELDGELEIKRMYVVPNRRGQGIADELLAAMEQTARDEGARRVIIHTGDQQHAALKFYDRHGYTPIPVYPPYEEVTYSLCFEKLL